MPMWMPLPIWAEASTEVDFPRLKAVKESLWLDYTVKPVNAVPSIDARVLAWGTAPPFVTAYALVDPLGSDDELAEALAWVLRESDECAVAMEVGDVMSVLLGPGTQEIPAEVLEAEQRLLDYERGA